MSITEIHTKPRISSALPAAYPVSTQVTDVTTHNTVVSTH